MQKYGTLFRYTTLTLKKTLLCGLCLLPFTGWALSPNALGPGSAAEKNTRHTVRRADSLFVAGQFAAAVPLFRAVVWRQRQVSPQLLLKLAYAQQRQGHEAAALLYLSLAQARQPRLDTWHQLVGLATRLRLVGYPSTWQQEVRVRASGYYYPGLQGLLLLAVLGAVGLGLRRRRVRRGAWLLYGGFLGVVALYLHLLRPDTAGLVVRPGAALMAGPGAGAAWLSTAAVGDRLQVLGREDIWCRVRWQQRTVFIRDADLLVMEQ